ncbi:TonB-dependent receptor [Gimibacter soli]|uniref:TonB-dependent receptor n=1 Tax=Gimibacter soli TaxID=3024400 RepID=A0AAE9XPH6_9PROT|nr:TonB-dependent receptor [Gimibacter soli]WCL53842.1 TonB-dependent receptor [Gimibacter soli]
MEKISGSAAVHLRMTKLLAAASLISVAITGAALAQDGAGAAEDEADVLDEIVVTGFRQSLTAAINVKKNSTSAVDAIVAEDIAKFPDQNLAESLQRIPGISIQRDAGEGRSITVRGLGAQFTRVRLNGMETITTSTDGASANRDRSFDFNVFASELFNSIVVRKTAEASLDEGSLGAVIDLNTGNPLSYDEGTTFVASAKAQYNDLSEDLSPRVAALGAWVNDEKTFGISASVAFSDYETLEMGNNSVRWQQARFRSVGGVSCADANAACDEVANAFHPRIPRYGEVGHDRQRLGATASIQFAPSEATKVSIDGLYSKFEETRTEKWGEVLFRGNEGTMDIRDYVIQGTNMISATVDNAWVRIEDYRRDSSTEFHQLSAKLEQDITDTFRIELLGGFSQSDADIPLETTIIFDDRDTTGYSYDYSNMKTPVLSFGPGIDDPTAFQFAEFRDRPSFLTNKFRNLALDAEWDVNDNIQLVSGAMYRRFSFDTVGYRRDSTYCSAFTCEPGTYGAPVTADLADMFELGDAGQPSGNTNSWVVPNMAAAADLIDLYGREAALRQAEDRGVIETVKGGFLQANLTGEMGNMAISANAGMRYAHTKQSSTGFNNGTEVTVERTYDDWLPSANLAIFPTPEFAIRAAVAKVITRPTLGSLTPGGSVDGFNYRVTSGNPFLTPYRATNFDLAFEWYFMDDAIASVALFKKDIKSFPISTTTTGTYASTGLPLSLIDPGSPAAANPEGRPWEIRSTGDGPGANVKGVEFSVQTPFTFLPGVWSNFGTILNLTLVDSDVDYEIGGNIYTEPLLGLSKKAANGTLYYEDEKFSARVSVAYRGGYIDGTSATNNIFEGYNSSMNVDASIRYEIMDGLEVSLEGINLTDDYRDRYTDLYEQRNYEYNHYGRVFMFGVRYKL